MSVGLARVTIHAPQRRVDVALPEHVPLADLLPDVLRQAGEDLADQGERHGGWVLRRADGAALRVAQGLLAQGVRDGEILHLVPAGDEWPEPEYDDVVDAIAEGARRRGGTWTPDTTRAVAPVAAAVPLTLGLVTLFAHPGGAGWVGLGLAALLTLAGSFTSRAYAQSTAGVTLAGSALPYAFAGGAASVTSDPASWTWIGAPELLAGSVSVLILAAFGGAGVAAGTRLFTAGVTAGLLGAATALIGLFTPAATAAAALLSVLVCGIALLPLLAVRLGRMPRPPIGPPAPGEEAIVDRVRVFDAVGRTEELLAGMLLAHAALAAGTFAVLASAGTLAARLLMAVGAIALLLRARLFVTRRQRLPLIAGGLTGLLALGADLLLTGPGPAVLTGHPGAVAALCAGLVLLALLIVAAGATYADRPPSPYLSRAADIVDALAVIAVIPVACAVAGLYGTLSGLA